MTPPLPRSDTATLTRATVDPTTHAATTGTGSRASHRFARLSRWQSWFDRKWQARGLLVIIVFAAVAIRVTGSRYGFPLLLHPDEWAVVDGVIDMAKRNSFEPPWSLRPDHVEMKIDYLLFAAYAAGFKHLPVEVAFAQDPVPFYWIARLATVAFGVATVVVAYLIGRLTSVRLGLVMAALFAIFPAFVRNSHFATPDVPLTFAFMLLTYALMRYVRNPSWSSLLWSSLAVALGIAIKYPAAIGAVMIGVVIVAVAVRDKQWLRVVVHGAGAFGALLGFLFVISPVLFTNISGVRGELKVQSAGDRLGHPDLGLLGNLQFYAESYAHNSGVILLLLGLVGLILVIRCRELDRLPWFIGVLVWLALSTLPMTWERWGLPMWITPLLLASVALVYLFERFRSWRTVWIPYAVALVVGVHLLISSAMVDAGRTAADTRTAALRYAEEHGIRPTNSIYEGYTPFLPGTSRLFFKQVKNVGDGHEFQTTQGSPAEYAILSSAEYGRMLADDSRVEEQAIYQWIFQHGELVAQFAPMPNAKMSSLEPIAISENLGFVKNALEGGRSGPVIKIYRLPQTSS